MTDPDGEHVVYAVHGELFFASSNDLVAQFDYAGDPGHVTVDLSGAHIWAASALDAVTTRYEVRGKQVEITGLSERSTTVHSRRSGELTGSHRAGTSVDSGARRAA